MKFNEHLCICKCTYEFSYESLQLLQNNTENGFNLHVCLKQFFSLYTIIQSYSFPHFKFVSPILFSYIFTVIKHYY